MVVVILNGEGKSCELDDDEYFFNLFSKKGCVYESAVLIFAVPSEISCEGKHKFIDKVVRKTRLNA